MEFQCKEGSSIVGYNDNDKGGNSNVPSSSSFFHPYDFALFTESVVPFFFFFFFSSNFQLMVSMFHILPWSKEYFFNDNTLVAFQRIISGVGIVECNQS